jgi:hypothetical protein
LIWAAKAISNLPKTLATLTLRKSDPIKPRQTFTVKLTLPIFELLQVIKIFVKLIENYLHLGYPVYGNFLFFPAISMIGSKN